jgi:ribosomal protein S18 acetylase RimI-like enzyme
MTSLEELRLSRYDGSTARPIVPQLVEVYADVYADRADNPFFSVARFAARLENHLTAPRFALVTGEVDGDLVGYAYGASLRAGTLWWAGLREPVPPELLAETGDRTFALNEIMVRAPWRRRGIAQRLHGQLLADRPESRATLLVEQENDPARAAYRAWGWRNVGHLQPFPDAPVYESMLLDLPR